MAISATHRRLRRRLALEQRNRLVQAHWDLVRPIAIHYGRCCRESVEDLHQVGMIGLIRAAERFDAQQGTPFGAFARPHIRGAILHHLRDVAPSVRLPRRQAELQERLLRLERHLLQQGRVATSADLQRLLNIDAEQWNLLMRQRRLNRAEALTEIAEEELDQADSEAEADLNVAEAETVQDLLKGLDPRQREVVQQVVLSGFSYRQIARRMQVSPMTVQRLLHRGLEQLRGDLEVANFRSPERVDPGRSAARAC
ncbi:MAG: sigma-70 family RNA polymerase sigma factor [Cyanobacteria bacterium]|nr:sigma-70 family RNA polymerase sigma factor [Cyanobacteriota bacterium]